MHPIMLHINVLEGLFATQFGLLPITAAASGGGFKAFWAMFDNEIIIGGQV